MKIPHSEPGSARSQGRCSGVRRPGPGSSARGKSSEGLEFPGSALHGAAKVIVGVGVAAWKTGAARAHNGGGPTSGDSVAEQFLGDPFIDDAPIRLWEACVNPQPVQPIGIDPGGNRVCEIGIRIECCQHGERQQERRFVAGSGLSLTELSACCRRAAPSLARPARAYRTLTQGA